MPPHLHLDLSRQPGNEKAEVEEWGPDHRHRSAKGARKIPEGSLSQEPVRVSNSLILCEH
jgi:hypothetical protein